MPKNQFERIMYALMTVIVTVNVFVFYSLYGVNGSMLMQLNGESGVFKSIAKQGGGMVNRRPVLDFY